MTPQIVSFADADGLLSWGELSDFLISGHRLPRAKIEDSLMSRGADTVLSRAAWIDGLGIAVKTATIFPNNSTEKRPVINGGVNLFSDTDGMLEAVIDFHLVTKWKTAGDSIAAAQKLARADSNRILIVGAGTVAHSMYQAYRAVFPTAQFQVWNRTYERAVDMATNLPNITPIMDLKAGVETSDIITCATMSQQPVIFGEWLCSGQHIDLIGAYRPDMREVDDVALKRAKLYVDCRETTVEHIGELKTPIKSGVISPDDIIADFYDHENLVRSNDQDITIFKNGGGAHLDLMTARYILNKWGQGNI